MWRILGSAILLSVLAACSRAVKVNQPNPLSVEARDYDLLYQQAIHLLRDEGFVIDQQDYRFGVVTTRPRTAPTLFEPWHDDNTTPAQALDSTLSHQRRTVTVTLKPDPSAAREQIVLDVESIGFTGPEAAVRDIDAALDQSPASVTRYDRYLLEVAVVIERQQRPLRRLTGSMAGRNLFSSLSAVPGEWQDQGITAQYWLAEGRDLPLEQRLLQALLRRAQATAAEPSADGRSEPGADDSRR